MKKILLFLGIIGIIIYFNYTGNAIDPTIYMGNKNVFGGIYVTSTSVNAFAHQPNYQPLISSWTYLNRADAVFWGDKNGLNVYISSSPTMTTTSGKDCVKFYPGEPISWGGKNTDAIYARTLAGAAGTTVWYIISYQDR